MATDKPKATNTATEVVPWEDDIVPAMIEPTPDLVEAAYAAILDGKLPPEVGDPSVTARAIQERIKNAKTFEDAFRPSSLQSWQDYADKPVIVHSFHLNPSNFEGQTAYAVVELGIPETGEFLTVSTGGGNVLTQLVKAWELGAFPFRAILKVKDTGTPGRVTLWLESA